MMSQKGDDNNLIRVYKNQIIMDNSVLSTKEQREFNRQLNHHINQYSSLRDWSELTIWLSKLRHMLNDYKGNIIDKTSVLKKLSTSLNASLPPAVHESCLEIYEIMLSKFVAVENLEYLCLGLFSFYSVANIKSRIRVIQILRTHLPRFGREIRMMATGLLVTVLPSFIQMSETLVKEVNEFFDELSSVELLGHELTVESIWIAILRSSSCRIAGLKYLSVKLGKVEDDEENDEDEDNFWNESLRLSASISKSQKLQTGEDQKNTACTKRIQVKEYCPYIQILVRNALIACVEDSNILATKSALDFLYKYLPIKSEIISDESKMKLANSVIWLLAKRDVGVTRKVNLWLFGRVDQEDKFTINPKHLRFIAEPIINFLQRRDTIKPLKIVFNLFNEHEQLPSMLMGQLSKELIDFCMREQANPETLKLMQRLLDKLENKIMMLVNSLAESLFQSISDKNYAEADHLLQLIVYLVHKILRPDENKRALLEILKTIMKSYQMAAQDDVEYLRTALNVTFQLLEDYKDMLKSHKGSEQSSREFLHNIQIYKQFVEKVEESNSELYEQEIQSLCKIQVRINDIFDVYEDEWVQILVRNIYLRNPQHYLTPLEVMGDSLEKQGHLKTEIIKRSENPDNCIQTAIHKLWSVMNLGHLHFKVVPLLLRLIKFFPHFFSVTLNSEFLNDIEVSISKFSIFWQLSPKYPAIVSHHHLSEICKPGLFRMLELLESGNPLVKYNTQIWVNGCFPAFNRILDPLLEIIFQPSDCWYRTIKGQYVFAINPEVKIVLNAIRWLTSVIKSTGQKFFDFSLKHLTPHIQPYYEIFAGKQYVESLEKTERMDKDNSSQVCYLRSIFEIVVRFLGSKFACVEGEDPQLDITCCELLETIIKRISDPNTCLRYVCLNIEEIFMALHFATMNESHIVQIQLLNLLDTIFFASRLRSSGESGSRKLKAVVSSPYFTRTILEGLNTKFPYIKQRFVEFINKSIALYLQYHGKCSELISEILNTYLSKIMLVHTQRLESRQHKDIEISKRNSEILILLGGMKEILSYFLNLSAKPFEKEKEQHEPDSGIFSLYTWTSYVNLKIEKKVLVTGRARRNAEEISKLMPNELQNLLLTMTTCWTLSPLAPHYKISLEGLSEFNFNDFLSFNKQLESLFGKDESEQSVQTFIVDLIRLLINHYPREIMNGMIKNWVSAVTVEQKIKIVEILNMSSISIEHFYSIMSETFNAEMHKKKKSVNLVFEKSVEQEILHFCQFFTHYSFQNKCIPKLNNQLSIWNYFLKFVHLFENSRSIFTLFSLVELLHLFLHKNNPKEILREEKMKKQTQYLVSIFNELVMVCSGKIRISVSEQNCHDLGLHSFVPLPTSVFEIYSAQIGKIEEAKVSYMFFNQLSAEKVLVYCRIYAFLILKRVGYDCLQILSGDNQVLLVKKAREVLSSILTVTLDKNQSTQFVECASEVVMTLMERRASFSKQMKQEVLEIFNKDDFFICSSKTLHCWVKIIDRIIDNNKDHDIFTEYLEKVSLVSSIFSSYTSETKKKIKSFERICFILYAGRRDKYNDKSHLLIEKIVEVIKDAEAPQPVLILIFFCIRILILRTSPERLTKLLANIWQLIMFLLTNIFRREKETLKDKNNLNLLWAAMKLIEIVSIMELNEFHPHQWIFFYDFIGLKFSTSPDELSQEALKVDPKVKPLIAKYLPSSAIPYQDEVGEIPEEGHLIIKEDKIDDIELLKTKALLLSSYLIRNNQCKMRLSMEEVENLIENDFLHLDEFIFKLK